MLSLRAPLLVMIGVALIFDYLNGFHDSSNIVATMISSRAMSPRRALGLTAVAHFVAPFLFGTAVARTVGSEVVSPEAVSTTVITAALLSAILWNVVTWLMGIPSSSSHALVGGIIGASVLEAGAGVIHLAGVIKIAVALLLSPLVGMMTGYLFMKLVLFLVRGASPRVNRWFKRLQTVTALGLALSHGTNDAQKTMGIITMGLVTAGTLSDFTVPWWVVTVSAGAIALGTASGGWRIIRTLGTKFYKIRPIHGFTTQAASATVVLVAALLGGPVSTTHVVSSAIVGVGSAERMAKVRWGVMREIATAWLLTIPASAAMAVILYLGLAYLNVGM